MSGDSMSTLSRNISSRNSLTIVAITFTRVYTLPGSNEIQYEGKTWTKFEYKIDPNIIDRNVYGK